MRSPRLLRSNTPSVHIDKDRGGEAIVLSPIQSRSSIEREITDGLERMQVQLGMNSSCGGVEADTLVSSSAEKAAERSVQGVETGRNAVLQTAGPRRQAQAFGVGVAPRPQEAHHECRSERRGETWGHGTSTPEGITPAACRLTSGRTGVSTLSEKGGAQTSASGVTGRRDGRHPKSFGMKIAEATLIGCCIVGLVLMFTPRAKAQQLAQGDLTPGPVYCNDASEKLAKLKGNPQFRTPRAISGYEAAYWSQEVFGFVPPLDHAIVIPQTDGGTILVPCVIGPDGPMWGSEQSNRVAIDQTYRRSLSSPMTDRPEQQTKAPKRTRKAKQ